MELLAHRISGCQVINYYWELWEGRRKEDKTVVGLGKGASWGISRGIWKRRRIRQGKEMFGAESCKLHEIFKRRVCGDRIDQEMRKKDNNFNWLKRKWVSFSSHVLGHLSVLVVAIGAALTASTGGYLVLSWRRKFDRARIDRALTTTTNFTDQLTLVLAETFVLQNLL